MKCDKCKEEIPELVTTLDGLIQGKVNISVNTDEGVFSNGYLIGMDGEFMVITTPEKPGRTYFIPRSVIESIKTR